MSNVSMKVPDETPAIVQCSYSNIACEWCAEVKHAESGEVLAYAIASTRPEALRRLADMMEEFH